MTEYFVYALCAAPKANGDHAAGIASDEPAPVAKWMVGRMLTDRLRLADYGHRSRSDLRLVVRS